MNAKNESGAAQGVAEFEAAFGKNYTAAQYHFVQFIADHLADCSRVFGGDLQLPLVLAIIGQSYLNALIREGAPWPPSTPAETDTAINASRIADVTGIPRETVRRKLALLEERGWIEQTASQSWKLVVSGQKSKVYGDLAALDARGIARAARFLAALRQLT